MIEKTINYIWLSKERMPLLNRRCIASWKRILSDYKIRKWTLKDFDLSEMPYVREAVKAKKWAFATDFLRLYVLKSQGGFYLDSDVFVLKKFDDMLDSSFCSCIEYHHDSISTAIQAAFLGAEKNSPFVSKALSYYDNHHFIRDDGSFNMDILAPDVLAQEAKSFGFENRPVEQHLKGRIDIYDSHKVAGTPWERHQDNVAVHMCAGSWCNYGFKVRLKKNLSIIKIEQETKNRSTF